VQGRSRKRARLEDLVKPVSLSRLNAMVSELSLRRGLKIYIFTRALRSGLSQVRSYSKMLMDPKMLGK
jgi:hypothetical protein